MGSSSGFRFGFGRFRSRYLGSQCFSAAGIGLGLGSESGCLLLGFGLLQAVYLTVYFFFFRFEPFGKTCVGYFLREGTFAYTAVEVLFQQRSLVGKDTLCRQGGLCALLQPSYGAVQIQDDGGGVGVGVVRTEFLDETAVAFVRRIGYDDLVKRFALFTMSLKTNLYQVVLCGLRGYPTLLVNDIFASCPRKRGKDTNFLFFQKDLPYFCPDV